MSTKLIIDNMKKLVEVHEQLHDFAKEKTASITKGDISHLKSLIQKEAASVKQLERLENERQRLVHFYIQGKGLVTESGTLSELLTHIEDDDREELQQMQKNLVELISDLKKVNELNQQLIEDSLRFVNLSLDVLQPEPETGNYGRPDKEKDQPYGRSIFDSKA